MTSTLQPFNTSTRPRSARAPGCKVLSPAQNALYWRAWAKAKAMLQLGGMKDAQELEAKRHEIHTEALGTDKSHKDFTNKDLDRVLDAFDAYNLHADPQKARRAIEQPRIRALAAIDDLAYQMDWTADTLDHHAQHFANVYEGPWSQWTELQLKAFLSHLTNKARAAKAHTAAAAGHDPF
jgi:hypothetical protein